MKAEPQPARQTRYTEIAESIRTDIMNGKYRPGARLPSEAELVRRFHVSRMTVVKAIQRLQAEGLVLRRPGSGTYAAGIDSGRSRTFGLMIPDLGNTEIFETICRGMMRSPSVTTGSLSWGHIASPTNHQEDEAQQLCNQYIRQKVDGVFFAPLEHSEHRHSVNERILLELERAHIPVVLLDRDSGIYPQRSRYDLVGIENRRAGYLMTEHLIRQGAKRVAFFAVEQAAETVDNRIVGYREALFVHDMPVDKKLLVRGNPSDATLLEYMIRSQCADAVLCANDHTAARLMRTLLAMGVRVPTDVRMAGVDDVRYASLLPVPLTTFHQPCTDIGVVSMAAMMDRLQNPQLPTRTIRLNGRLVVRASCGTPSTKR